MDWFQPTNWFLENTELREWPPLRQEELDLVDWTYFGPQLELLDLSELDTIV